MLQEGFSLKLAASGSVCDHRCTYVQPSRITKRNLTSAPSPFVGSGAGLRLKCKMNCTHNMENTVVSREWLSYVLYTTEIYEWSQDVVKM